VFVSGAFLATLLLALEGKGSDKAARKSASGKPAALPAFTPERERAALQFVDTHHADLRSVLERLKNLNREQYEQAIRQLFQEAEKLTLVKANDEALYELMLESWQVKSKSELLAARLASMKEERAGLEAELKKLLYRQVDLHRLQVEHNHRRAVEAVKVMEANIELLREKRDDIVDRRFRTLTGKASIPAKKQKKIPE
jgi:hypothetical protein